MNKKYYLLLLTCCFCFTNTFAQSPEKWNSAKIYHQLEKLNFLGSVLYVAAHPDDENTRLISYFANDVKARTAYISLTRGDGGQNLVGPELRELLGVIRTHELIEARKVDGGEQFFTRANDFGYSKTPDETLAIWNKDAVLSDLVQVIRQFKPDIIINRFDHRSPGTTHGHHTTSAMLAVECFDQLSNNNYFPESANKYGAWQPSRLFFNTSWWFYGSRENFEKADKTSLISVETGAYFPMLGLSNGEIAALSRSKHQSQGFGSTGSRGNETEYLELIKGTFPASGNPFEGINTTWSRIEGGESIGDFIENILKNFNFKNPSSHLPQLMEAYQKINSLENSYWKIQKLKEVEEIILQCSGLFIEVLANAQNTTPKGPITATVEIINRGDAIMQLNGISSPIITFPSNFAPVPLQKNIKYTQTSVANTFTGQQYTTPYWLLEEGTLGLYKVSNPDLIGIPSINNTFPVSFSFSIQNTPITFTKNIVYKYNDPVEGEVYQPFQVLPDASVAINEKVIIFSKPDAHEVKVAVTANRENLSGTVMLQHPKNWVITPAQQTFQFNKTGQQQTFIFKVTPPKSKSEVYLQPLVQIGDQYIDTEMVTLNYKHIPYQTILMPSKTKAVRIPIDKKGNDIGYINGAGDQVAASLKQIGYKVTELTVNDITLNKLKEFDAVVIGIRAYNVEDQLTNKQPFLNKYVEQGGTVLAQYNTSRGLNDENLAPYPLKLSRDRVTNEQSPVKFINANHPVLNTPNKITQEDFEGWVQERGLYFPQEWGEAFTPILEMNDPNESPLQGALLVSKYGKGYYIYTGLSFFRELPAGVSGAYRLIANLLSIGK